jgi:hypothetical protein
MLAVMESALAGVALRRAIWRKPTLHAPDDSCFLQCPHVDG